MTETLELAPTRTSGAQSVIVVGAGLTGLTAAYRLLQHGFKVRVFEASDTVGGLVRTFEAGGEPLECFYHHLFKSDEAAIRLIEEVGLGERLTWRPSKVGVYHGGRVYPFTNAMDLLRFAPLGLRERIRLGLTARRLRREENWSAYENVTASEWVSNHLGERCLDVLWRPLLRGKFGEMADDVVMTWLWSKIRTRFSSRSSDGLTGGEILGYQMGSFGAVAEALAGRVRELGGQIETGRPITRILKRKRRMGVEVEGDVHLADSVISTVPNEVFMRLSPPLGKEYTERLNSIPYQDALCLVLSLKRPLSDYYWLSICDESAPFTAVVEHTNLVGTESYAGQHIVYLSSYLGSNSTLFEASAEELFKLYVRHLKQINPQFEESWLNGSWVFHGRGAQPVFTVGRGSRIAGHRTPIEGLYLANMGQIYPQDRGQNYAIELGERVATAVEMDVALALLARNRT